MVVSPDGSIRSYPHGNAHFAVEVKCPYTEKRYTTQIHYNLPNFYVLQVMLEMQALNCQELIFLSYTDASSCVFKVQFSEELWAHIVEELRFLYGGQTLQKQTRLRPEAKILKEKIKEFTRKNAVRV